MYCTLCWAMCSEEGWTAVHTACRAAQCLSGESHWRMGSKGGRPSRRLRGESAGVENTSGVP